MLKTLAGFAALGLAGLLLTPLPASATTPGFNGKIVFSAFPRSCTVNCTRFSRLFTVNENGFALHQIASTTPVTTAANFGDLEASWSPDGTMLAFARLSLDSGGSELDSIVYTTDADGGHLQQIAAAAGEPVWLPDGRLAIRDMSSGEVRVLDLQTGAAQSFLPAFFGSSVAFSADGNLAAFERLSDIWIADGSTGGAQRPLTQTLGLADGQPAFSPDGATVYFTCQIPLFLNVCAINPDGTNQHSLTVSTDPQRSGDPRPSPDGKVIAFSRTNGGDVGSYQLWLMQPDGTRQRPLLPLAPLPLQVSGSDWQPLHATFSPFSPPIANDGVNTLSAGQILPLSFSLGRDFGRDIFADGFPSFSGARCTAPAGPPSVQKVTNGSVFDNPLNGRYTYLWQTDRSWAGLCGSLTMRLLDGSERSIRVAFRSGR